MIYRVIIKNGYNELWLDFNNVVEAGSFAEAVLVRQTPNDDNDKRAYITIRVMNPEEISKEDED